MTAVDDQFSDDPNAPGIDSRTPMTDEPQTAVGEATVAEILGGYLSLINSTPAILSLLYDADLLPEQIVTMREAVCVAAVCEAYKAALSSVSERERGLVAALNCVEARDNGTLVVTIPADDPSEIRGGCYAWRCTAGSEIGPLVAERFAEIARSALQSMKGE